MLEFDPSERRPHLLIVSHDVIDVKMAGPGMRYLEMARASILIWISPWQSLQKIPWR